MKTVLITGTTSGIGYDLSELLAKEDYHIILVSRNRESLLKQKSKLQIVNSNIDIIDCNLEREDAADYIFEQLNDNNWKVDILINNAGFNEADSFLKTDIKKEINMINLHICFTTKLIKLLLVHMVDQGYGKILNVGSTGSYIACPNDAVYAATKAYLLHFSNALKSELKGTGVSVTTICPGSTKTEFAKKANMQNTLLFKVFVMNSNKVAGIGYKAMMKNKRVVIAGWYNKMLVFSSKLLPVSLISFVTKKMLVK